MKERKMDTGEQTGIFKDDNWETAVRREALNLAEQTVHFLLMESQRKDANRFLAGIRKPSVLTRIILDIISVFNEHRIALWEKEGKEEK